MSRLQSGLQGLKLVEGFESVLSLKIGLVPATFAKVLSSGI